MMSNAPTEHAHLNSTGDPWDPVGGALLVFFNCLWFLWLSFWEVFPSCSWCEIVSSKHSGWFISSGAFLILGSWPLMQIFGLDLKIARYSIAIYGLGSLMVVVVLLTIKQQPNDYYSLVTAFGYAAFWSMLLLASIWWARDARDGRALTAALAGSTAVAALLIFVYLGFSTTLVASNATEIAAKRPYCIQVVASYKGGYKPALSYYDLSRKRMWAHIDGIHSFHGVLMVRELEKTDYFNWSYRNSRFEPVSSDLVHRLRLSVTCHPSHDFVGTLPWLPISPTSVGPATYTDPSKS